MVLDHLPNTNRRNKSIAVTAANDDIIALPSASKKNDYPNPEKD